MTELTGERARQAAQKFENRVDELGDQIDAAINAGMHSQANDLISKQVEARERAEELREEA